MSRLPATEKRRRKQPAVRVGRPPRERAGEVDERILEAARRVFLERGLAGASMDEIARLARAGKPTIYARFPSKEALFTAVGIRNSAQLLERLGTHAPAGATIEERLVKLGTNILQRLLESDAIDFIRLSIAEVRRFPDLGSVGRIARERAGQAASQLLSEVGQSDAIGDFPAFAAERLATTTQFFIDLVVLRFFLRALTGENLKVLCAEIDTHVARSVAFFLAACRHEGVD